MLKTIELEQRHPEAIVPRYAHGPGEDNGVDLFAVERTVIRPGETVVVATGWAMKVPLGFGFFVLPRSGTSLKTDVRIANGPGLIDQGYRGEVGVLVWNKGENEIIIHPGDRIAQGVLLETPAMGFVVVQKLDDTSRGGAGYGSTGQ